MSSTATSQQLRPPVTVSAGMIGAALAAVALVALIGVAVLTFVRVDAPAVQFDPTAAQRIHLVREYGSAASYDASGALQTHVMTENHAAPATTIFDHVLRENGTN